MHICYFRCYTCAYGYLSLSSCNFHDGYFDGHYVHYDAISPSCGGSRMMS